MIKPEDDSMEIDETISSNQIIVRESDRIQIIGGQFEQLNQSADEQQQQSQEKQPEKRETNDEIVVLDDDDDDVDNSKSNIKDQPMEIIDLIQKPIADKCINYLCKGNDGKQMLIAPNFCLSYYRIKNVKAGKKEICIDCYNQALEHFDRSVTLLKENQSLTRMEIPIRNEIFEIDDSDDDDNNNNDNNKDADNDDNNDKCENDKKIEYLSRENIDFFVNNFDNILTKTLQSIDIKKQIDLEVNNIEMEQLNLKNDIDDVQKDLKDVRKLLDSIQNNLYDAFRGERKELAELIIDDDRFVPLEIQQKTPPPPPPPPQRKSQRTLTRRSYLTNTASVKENKENNEENRPVDCPVVGTLEKEPLIVDEIYYISRESHVQGSWIKARFKNVTIETTNNNNSSNDKQTNLQITKYKMLELKQHKERIVNGKNLAMSKPSKIRFEIGTRIIAPFKEITQTGDFRKTRHDCYYPGIVAEPPVAQNNYR